MTIRLNQLRLSKAVWAALLFSLLAFIPNAAHAQNATKQTMIYEVYAGGLHALQAKLTIDLTKPEAYDINLTAKTRGLLGKLAPWHGTFESKGWREDNDVAVALHRSTTVWRDEEEIKEYNYAKDGSFKNLTLKETGKDTEIKTPDGALTDQTTDTLTATLKVMQAIAGGATCEGSSDVFDGKRRFAQDFTFKDNTSLTASRYNIYEGPAQRCVVEVVPKGGKWHDKPRGWTSIQEQGRAKGTLPTLWIAQIEDNAPAVPVKLLVKTDYGSLFMHLTEYQGASTSLIAEKRAKMQQAKSE